jgi:hypothetical protein
MRNGMSSTPVAVFPVLVFFDRFDSVVVVVQAAGDLSEPLANVAFQVGVHHQPRGDEPQEL